MNPRAHEAVLFDLDPAQDDLCARERAWQIAEPRFSPERLARHESVFAVGNGYLGVRGAPEEGTPVHDPGVILNGFHETWPIVYPEDAYGLARTGQTIVDVTDGSIIRLFVDEEPFDLATARILRFERVLDMRIGVVVREVEWETAGGRRLLVRSRRLASLADRHLAAIEYQVVALDGAARVTLCSELVTHAPVQSTDDPRRGKGFAEKVLVPRDARAHGDSALLQLATRNSGLELGCGMAHRMDSPADVTVDANAEGDGARVVVRADLAAGESLRLSKFVAYHWERQAGAGDLLERVERTLAHAQAKGYGAIEAAHSAEVQEFWRRSDIELEGDPELQQAVRFNLFSLMQATARAEGLGVPAKGVTGRGYEGNYFWDNEIYVVPFLCHTTPRWAKQVLEFRCATLDAARTRAREIGHGGAAFPWRTINGSEASAWYAAGTAQHHINADIAYAMHQYNRVTGDLGLERYHAVVYAVGTPTDNRLGIPGDDRSGSVAATQLVAWYNGHPGYVDEAFDLSCSRPVVIGNGDVAIDVERMLVLDPDELASTDTADHAIEAFAAASVTEVVILGRRGPAQAAFTNPELRELGELARADVVVDPADLERDCSATGTGR